MNPEYQILVKNKAGESLGVFPIFFNLEFKDRLNNYGECIFGVPIKTPELVRLHVLRRHDVFILRDGEVQWSGEMANSWVQLAADTPQLLMIQCFTFYEQLNSMFSEPYERKEGVDQAVMLKELIDTFQAKTNGDRGLTFASITNTQNRDRDFHVYNIMQAHINMSNVIGGVDSWIDHDKVVHYALKRGIDRSAVTSFEWPTNISSALIKNNFSNPTTQAIVLGQSTGAEQAIGSYEDVSASETYFLRQSRISDIDLSVETTLEERAEKYVEERKQAIVSVEMDQFPNTVPVFGTIGIGDTVSVVINEGIINISIPHRIYGYEVRIGENGEEYVKYNISTLE